MFDDFYYEPPVQELGIKFSDVLISSYSTGGSGGGDQSAELGLTADEAEQVLGPDGSVEAFTMVEILISS